MIGVINIFTLLLLGYVTMSTWCVCVARCMEYLSWKGEMLTILTRIPILRFFLDIFGHSDNALQ